MFPLRDVNQSRTKPFINWLLIAVNVSVFYFELGMNRLQLNQLIVQHGIVPARFVEHLGVDELSTIFSSMFMHAGWLHLVSNMWILYIFGDNIEDRMGHGRFLIFYLFCGIVAALAQIVTGPHVSLPTIGASGAIGGVLGAYIVLFPRAKVVTLVLFGLIPLFIQVPSLVYLGIWIGSQMFSGVASLDNSQVAAAGSVAWWEHVGGFLTGALTVRSLQKPDTRR